MEYLSNKIGDSFKNWKACTIQFITAPTGTGKTLFILNSLAMHAKKQNKKVLYLVNRIILKKQLEKEINKMRLYDVIYIETYQDLEKRIKKDILKYSNEVLLKLYNKYDEYLPIGIKCCNCLSQDLDLFKDIYLMMFLSHEDAFYIVCDESHYFYQDSTFNTNTALSYKWIMSKIFLQCKIGIFMSATMDIIKDKIIEDIRMTKEQIIKFHNLFLDFPREQIGRQTDYAYNFQCIEQIHNSLKINVLPRFTAMINSAKAYDEIDSEKDYSYIVLHRFDNLEQIPAIVNSDNKSKWFIFINDKQIGENLRDEIMKKNNITEVVCLHSHYDKLGEPKEEINEMVQKKVMKNRVVISTSVMDNGVSIHDEELENMIILADTKEDFVQMVGRKRRDTNQKKLNVYICKRKKGYFDNRCAEVNQLNSFMENSSNLTRIDLLDKILSNKWVYDKAKQVLYTLNGGIAWNEWSVYKIGILKQYYEDLICRFNNEGEDAFLKQQAEWLGIPYDQIKKDVVQANKEEKVTRVRGILQDNLNKELSEKDYVDVIKKICKDLRDLLKGIEENEECNKDDLKKLFNTLKGDRPVTVQNFKKINKLLLLGYSVTKDGDIYQIIQE